MNQVYGANRYAFFIQHRQKLPHDLYLKGDINYVSDGFIPRILTRTFRRAQRLIREV